MYSNITLDNVLILYLCLHMSLQLQMLRLLVQDMFDRQTGSTIMFVPVQKHVSV